MFKLNKILTLSLASTAVILTGCGSDDGTTPVQQVTGETITIAMMSGAEAELAAKAATVAKAQFDLNVKFKLYSDFSQPNQALANGEVDANLFQYQSELDNTGYDFTAIADTFAYPLVAYSSNLNSSGEISSCARILIPKETQAMSRALRMLAAEGLIQLQDDGGDLSVSSIVANVNNLDIMVYEPAQTATVLSDENVSIVIVDPSITASANLAADSLFVEADASRYVHKVVTRANNSENQNILNFVQAYQSDTVYNQAEVIFNSHVVKGW